MNYMTMAVGILTPLTLIPILSLVHHKHTQIFLSFLRRISLLCFNIVPFHGLWHVWMEGSVSVMRALQGPLVSLGLSFCLPRYLIWLIPLTFRILSGMRALVLHHLSSILTSLSRVNSWSTTTLSSSSITNLLPSHLLRPLYPLIILSHTSTLI